MMIVCAVLVVGALAVRVILLERTPHHSRFQHAGPIPSSQRVDTLALGALLSACTLRRAARRPQAFRPAALIVATGAFAVLTKLFITHDGLSGFDRDVQTIGFSALALFYASLLLLVITSRPGATLYRIFTHPSLTFLGRYSYAIYVFHLLIAVELGAELVRRGQLRTVFGSQIPMNIIVSLALTAISVTAAWLSWHLFEKQGPEIEALRAIWT